MIDDITLPLWEQIKFIVTDIDLYFCLISTYMLMGVYKLALNSRLSKIPETERLLVNHIAAFLIMYLCVYYNFREFGYVHKLAFFLGLTNPIIYGVASKLLVQKFPVLEGIIKPHRYANNTTKPSKK